MRRTTVGLREKEVVTLDEAIRLFQMHQRAKGLAECTTATFDWIVPVFKSDLGFDENTPVTVICDATITEWKSILINVRKLKPQTTNSYVSRMRTFSYWCIKEGYVPDFKINLIKMQEEPMKYYTDEQLRILLKKPNPKNYTEYRTWLIISFILATGARAATVRFVKWEDVDFESRKVVYRHLKNKSSTIIPIPQSLCTILLEYQKIWNTGSEWLFCDVASGQLTTSAMRQALKKYCIKRDVPTYGLHSLRHSFARIFVASGGGAFQLQQMLTHSTLAMTRRYVQFFNPEMEEEVRQYNPLDRLKSQGQGGKFKTVRSNI